MKPIIIDMKEMSDSTEVYEEKPNPILTWFIYLILLITVVAFLWMYFCKVDIVVKGMGTVAASKEVATVTNQVSGVIKERKVEDGQKVQKGDILYTVSCEDVSLQLTSLEKQLADAEEREQMLSAYSAWLENGVEFAEELSGNKYFSEISARKILMELSEKSTWQTYSGELSDYEAKLSANEEMQKYYSEAIAKSRQLIEAIKNRENIFSGEEGYYRSTLENYLTQYQYTVDQYSDKIEPLQRECKKAEEEIQNIQAQKEEVQQAISALQQIDVSGGNAVETERASLEKQLIACDTGIASLEAEIETRQVAIAEYQKQQNSALNAYEKESIAAVENMILGYEQNMAAYTGTEIEYTSGQNTLKSQGTEVQLNNLVTQEKHNVAGELESGRQSRQKIEQQIKEIQQNIKNATVKATSDGYVNLLSDLVEGDYLAAGEQILSIIPETEEGTFIVKSYLENKDIAKVHEGMEVTYEISAYPSREYGTMRGEVTFVSPDLKVNNSGSAYYAVETSVDAGEFCNHLGEEASLKVGMLCETKIIIEKRRVLAVLLDKLFQIG